MLFDETVTQGHEPVYPLALMLVVVGVIFMPLGLLMSPAILILIYAVPRLKWFVLILSGLLMAINVFMFPVTLKSLVLLHHQALLTAIKGKGFKAFTAYLWVSAIPYAGIFGVLLYAFLGRTSPMQQNLKRVSQGQAIVSKKKLSEKKIQQALQKIKTSAIEGGSILGVNQMTGESVILTDQQANSHVLVLGTTGSGKTVTLCNMIESIIQRGLPLIFLDGKGDIALSKKVENYAEKYNRKSYIFRMQGESAHYNPDLAPKTWTLC